MHDGWEKSPDETRLANKTITFTIFCEDQVIEPSYFQAFKEPGKVHVSTVKNQRSNLHIYKEALAYCAYNELFDEANEEGFVVKSDIMNHIWIVFDFDVNLSGDPDPGILRIANTFFTTSIKQAEANGINVAWSNDVFELWILLHFEDVTPAVPINRTDIYARLTTIFKAFPGQSAEMLKITEDPDFDYKKKQTKIFNSYVLPLLASRRSQAIQRAKILDAAFTAKHWYHERNPCTTVYHLVGGLEKANGKQPEGR